MYFIMRNMWRSEARETWKRQVQAWWGRGRNRLEWKEGPGRLRLEWGGALNPARQWTMEHAVHSTAIVGAAAYISAGKTG